MQKYKIICAILMSTIAFNTYSTEHYTIRFAEVMDVQVSENKPAIHVNQAAGVIAFADDQKQAEALSEKLPEVYYLIKGKTVSETIEQWAKINGYKSFFQSEEDFMIEANSVIYGKFLDKSGALETLLAALKTSDMPFKAEIMANNVLLIKPGTFSAGFLMPG